MTIRRNRSEEFFIIIQKIFWLVVLPILGILGYNTNLPIFAPQVFWVMLFVGIAMTVSTYLPVQFEYDHHKQQYFDKHTGRYISRARVDTTREIVKGIGVGILIYLVGGVLGNLLSQAWSIAELIGAVAAIPLIVVELRTLLFDFVPYTGRSGLMRKGEFDSLGQAPKYWNKAVDYKRSGQWSEAINNYKQAEREILEHNPNSKRLADVYHQIGTCMMRKTPPEYHNAIQSFNQAVKIDARDIGSIYKRGVCFGKLGDHRRARVEFLTVLEQDPGNEQATYALRIADSHLLK